MSLSADETKQLLERLVFTDGTAEDWVQDVWALSPTLGETAARLVDVLDGLIDGTPEERLESLLQSFYREQLEE
jgi:phage-related baseplate assembly protein